MIFSRVGIIANERTAQQAILSTKKRLSIKVNLQTDPFWKWAMLVSNQRSLPCEGSAMVCWRFLEIAEFPQIAVLMS